MMAKATVTFMHSILSGYLPSNKFPENMKPGFIYATIIQP
jgi:hypothetical protein